MDRESHHTIPATEECASIEGNKDIFSELEM